MITFTLDNGEDIAKGAPQTFHIPPRNQRESILPGDIVKLIFRLETETEAFVERMWVIVKGVGDAGTFTGVLDNDPTCTDEIKSGIEVTFGPEHVIAIHSD
jgi:uncharacterized protein YegJ (DUF2314 family)